MVIKMTRGSDVLTGPSLDRLRAAARQTQRLAFSPISTGHTSQKRRHYPQGSLYKHARLADSGWVTRAVVHPKLTAYPTRTTRRVPGLDLEVRVRRPDLPDVQIRPSEMEASRDRLRTPDLLLVVPANRVLTRASSNLDTGRIVTTATFFIGSSRSARNHQRSRTDCRYYRNILQ